MMEEILTSFPCEYIFSWLTNNPKTIFNVFYEIYHNKVSWKKF